MGTIHFVSGLESLTLKALKDAEDCADILKDLGRIKYTIAHGSEQEARALDYELQQKYPAIDAMLQAADNLQATRIPLCFTTVKSGSSAKSNLQQDYWENWQKKAGPSICWAPSPAWRSWRGSG